MSDNIEPIHIESFLNGYHPLIKIKWSDIIYLINLSRYHIKGVMEKYYTSKKVSKC